MSLVDDVIPELYRHMYREGKLVCLTTDDPEAFTVWRVYEAAKFIDAETQLSHFVVVSDCNMKARYASYVGQEEGGYRIWKTPVPVITFAEVE